MSQIIPRVFAEAARERGDADAMRYKQDGEWLPISWNGYRDAVWRAAGGFMRLGLEPGQGVAILGFNRPEWFIADLAAIVAGGLPAGIYTTCTPEQCQLRRRPLRGGGDRGRARRTAREDPLGARPAAPPARRSS